MKIYSKAIENNILNKNYGMNADKEYLIDNIPFTNFDFEWEVENSNSKYLHLLFIDYDAIPVCAKPWIHWTVANVDLSKIKSIKENDSINNKDLIQGKSSLIGEQNLKNKYEKYLNTYIGPMPPDKSHTYTLYVFTTSEPLNLKHGYFYNEMYKELQNKIIEQTKIDMIYIK